MFAILATLKENEAVFSIDSNFAAHIMTRYPRRQTVPHELLIFALNRTGQTGVMKHLKSKAAGQVSRSCAKEIFMSIFYIGDSMRKVVPKYSSNERSFLTAVNSKNNPKTDCCDNDQFSPLLQS